MVIYANSISFRGAANLERLMKGRTPLTVINVHPVPICSSGWNTSEMCAGMGGGGGGEAAIGPSVVPMK